MTAPGPDHHCDLLVVGSGAAGMAAAITGRKCGLDVLVVEKDRLLGGTTALSGGWLWIPGNEAGRRAGLADDRDAARRYIAQEAGPHYQPDLIEAYLDHAPAMLAFFERETRVQFELGREYPDYHAAFAGSVRGGRALRILPLDGTALGPDIRQLRTPPPALTFLGMTIGSGPDVRHFYNASRSLASAWYTAKRLMRYARDLLLHRRNMKLVNGEALSARLLLSARDLDIPVWTDSPAEQLVVENGAIAGAHVSRAGHPIRVHARRGVVLACGGFAADAARRQQLLPHHQGPEQHLTMVAESVTGDGLRMAEAVGGTMGDALENPVPWMPVSRVPRRDGSSARMIHVGDRGKPGFIAVLADGRRFISEALSYHDFVQAMVRAAPDRNDIACFLIADHRAVRKYGMGFAKPFPIPVTPYVRSGYLMRASSLAALAAQAGIDAATLATTVEQFNADAASGTDRAFGKGTTPYERFQGDAAHTPNPCVAPITQPPFYAVKILPGDIGSFAGLRTDHHARVMDEKGRAIHGLYAAGNDMHSVFGGGYPGAGATLGPAMTFGFIAARHAAQGTNY